MKLPDYIIIGAQKAGTSSVFSNIGKHPQINNPNIKEVHYYDNWYGNLYKYKKHFRHGSITGEATPKYCLREIYASRIYKDNPNAKLIFILRDPVYRAYSQWIMERDRGFEKRPLRQALRNEKHFCYVERGFYFRQINFYLKYFRGDQLLVLNFAELKYDPYSFYDKIFYFLGVDPFILPNLSIINVNKKYPSIDENNKRYLRNIYKETDKRLWELLEIDPWWGEGVSNQANSLVKPEPLTEQE